jgi:hypothetical protein
MPQNGKETVKFLALSGRAGGLLNPGWRSRRSGETKPGLFVCTPGRSSACDVRKRIRVSKAVPILFNCSTSFQSRASRQLCPEFVVFFSFAYFRVLSRKRYLLSLLRHGIFRSSPFPFETCAKLPCGPKYFWARARCPEQCVADECPPEAILPLTAEGVTERNQMHDQKPTPCSRKLSSTRKPELHVDGITSSSKLAKRFGVRRNSASVLIRVIRV